MNRALVVIDVQESFRRLPLWPAVSAPDIVDRVARLVDAARAAGDTVVWVLHAEAGSAGPFDPARGDVRLMDGLRPRAGEPVLTKSSRNAFTTTELHRLLTAGGVGEVVVCGIQTEQCCESTARLAADLGYRVTFVTDATATFPVPHPAAPAGRPAAEVLADPATLQVGEVIARTEYALAGRFAALASLDDFAAGVAVP
jgi:nicotinamidase-related amidase